MKRKEKTVWELRDELLTRYPALKACKSDIDRAYTLLVDCYRKGGKLLLAGNGGSASDSEHIVGELMKSFLFNRKINPNFENYIKELFGEDGTVLAGKLEGALPAIALPSMPALISAFANDVDAAISLAQMVYGYGNAGDVFWGISTSGNSKNILYALMVAKAKGLVTIGLTGESGGKMKSLCNVAICVPEEETFKIQEYHLPIYHTLCSMLEAELFEENI